MKTKIGMVPVGVLGLIAAASLAGCASTPTHESAAERINDHATTAKVKAALFADPDTKGHHIAVKTYRGVVELSGVVASTSQRDGAARVASHQPGVRAVDDQLEVTSSVRVVARAVDDTQITASVKAALSASPDTNAHDIDVVTSDGVVQLFGFVDSNAQRDAAVQVAQNVQGVRKIDNGLRLKPLKPPPS